MRSSGNSWFGKLLNYSLHTQALSWVCVRCSSLTVPNIQVRDARPRKVSVSSVVFCSSGEGGALSQPGNGSFERTAVLFVRRKVTVVRELLETLSWWLITCFFLFMALATLTHRGNRTGKTTQKPAPDSTIARIGRVAYASTYERHPSMTGVVCCSLIGWNTA